MLTVNSLQDDLTLISIDIALMVKQTYVEMRPDVETLLKKCAVADIPLLVFSAGVTDVIHEVLNQHNMFHHNMHIVSNKMGWNAKDVCDHFEEPLIHVFNKSEFSLETTDYYNTIKHRGNVILLGDSIGDVHMSQGIQHDICLNIGFLNHDVDTLIEKYSQLYDIVIVGDSSVAPVLSILEQI
jgi:HAD superfamily hydrolase (TIGR01544 family)